MAAFYRCVFICPVRVCARSSGMDRVPTGRVIFEIGGAPIREELAREGERFPNVAREP